MSFLRLHHAENRMCRLSSRQLNGVQDLIALTRLIALTSGEEFINDITGAMTAKNVNMVSQSSTGASSIPAIVVDDMIIRVPRGQQAVSAMEYSLTREAFVDDDILYYSRHLVTGKRITDIAYQRRPDNLIWVVLNDGTLLSCTFVPKQDFLAWTRHETQGEVLSVNTITNAEGKSELWLICRRVLGDGTTKQYIEVLAEPLPYNAEKSHIENSFYVDSGLSKTFASPVTVISGLEHLEGREVVGLADGNVVAKRHVINGTITLDQPASVVHVGLPYTWELHTLDLELANQGTLRNAKRMPWQATVEVYVTRELNYQINDGKTQRIEMQRGGNAGLVPEPLTGVYQLVARCGDASRTQIKFESSSPVPCGVLSLTAEIQHGNP